MTRAEWLADYEIAHGAILSPGKFEGEPVYVMAFWKVVLEGVSDETLYWTDGSVTEIVNVAAEDRTMWPEIDSDTVAISLGETDQGFVDSAQLTRKDLYDLMGTYELDSEGQED